MNRKLAELTTEELAQTLYQYLRPLLSNNDQKVHFLGKYDQKVRASACSTNRDLS